MNSRDIRIKPFGRHAVLVEWPMEVNEQILKSIVQFEAFLKKECLPGNSWEYVPSYNSLLMINKTIGIPFASFSDDLLHWYQTMEVSVPAARHLWRFPVSYDLSYGIDLEELAAQLHLSITDIIHLHTSHTYTVYGIGFLPGFMYLGGVPTALETTRKPTPRPKVQKGAVGIAGKQTGIYPQESPGGWNIIGNCPIPIFDSTKAEPCVVKVGDKIEFYSISEAEYHLHEIEVEVGIYKHHKTTLDA